MRNLLFIIVAATMCAQSFASDNSLKATIKTIENDTIITDDVMITTKVEKMDLLALPIDAKYIPLSMNSLKATNLELRGIEDIQEATRYMPGVNVTTTYGGFQNLAIRGFSHSPILIDGMRDERTTVNTYPFMDLSSVESMELLKGPASVLFGYSAVGGVINIIRKAPTPKQSVSARMSYGSYGDKQASLGFGGRLAGKFSYITNFHYGQNEGFRHTNDRRLSGYFAASGNISSRSTLDIRGGITSDFYGTDTGMPDVMPADIYSKDGSLYLKQGELLPGLDPRARYNNESDFMYNKAANISARYAYTISDKIKLTNHLTYNYDDIDYFSTESLDYLESESPIYDRYYTSDSGEKTYINLDSVQLTYPLRFAHIANTISNKLELTGSFEVAGIENTFVGGYSFMNTRRVSYSGYDIGTDVQGPGLFSIISSYEPQSMGYMTSKMSKANIYNYQVNGFYLQNLISLSDKVKVMLAGRYDIFDYTNQTAQTVDGEREYDSSTKSTKKSIQNHAFTYRAGFVYLPIDNLSIYGSIANFYKPIYAFYSPTTIYIDKHGNEFTPDENGSVFEPESGYQVETGFKYDINDYISFNGSVFYILQENIRETLDRFSDVDDQGNSVNMTVIGQVGRAKSKGFDMDITMRPKDNLELMVGYSYTHATVGDIANNAYIESSANSGNFITNIPQNSAFAYGNYRFARGIFNGLGIHASTTYTDKTYLDTANSKSLKDYWLTNIGASYYLMDGLRLTVNANNIFNQVYYTKVVTDQLAQNMTRNFQIAITYKM